MNETGAILGWASSIVAFAFVMSVTPGPNNILLMTCGERLGYRRAMPSLFGVAGGFAIVISLCNAGTNVWMPARGVVELCLNAAASAYMVFLAVRLWVGSKDHRADDSRLLSGMLRFTLFQFVNPKAWVASFAFTAGFLGSRNSWGAGADLFATALFVTITFCSCSLYVALGASTKSPDPERRKLFERALALLAAGTAVTFWV